MDGEAGVESGGGVVGTETSNSSISLFKYWRMLTISDKLGRYLSFFS